MPYPITDRHTSNWNIVNGRSYLNELYPPYRTVLPLRIPPICTVSRLMASSNATVLSMRLQVRSLGLGLSFNSLWHASGLRRASGLRNPRERETDFIHHHHLHHHPIPPIRTHTSCSPPVKHLLSSALSSAAPSPPRPATYVNSFPNKHDH
jgi:hypothetical protein